MAFALPNHTTYTAYKVFHLFGFPSQINTDQGREFESHLFSAMFKLLNKDKIRKCLYNLESGEIIDICNRSGLQILSMLVSEM